MKVDEPSQRAYVRKSDVPLELKCKIRRGEIVRLVPTSEDPTVLYATYCQPAQKSCGEVNDFYIVQSKKTISI